MNEDGRMARLDDLQNFQKNIKLRSHLLLILIAYRLKNEKLVYKIFSKNLNIKKFF